MSADLNGKVTVVTGASSGIGKAIAEKFAQMGSRVVLSARREEALTEAAKGIRSRGGIAEACVADVTDRAQVENLFDYTVREFGRVDILVNSAGFGLLKPFMDTSIKEIEDQIAVNINGLCYTCHSALERMLPRKEGQIINIGSIASLRPCANLAMYTVVKHAVYGFSRALYEENRENGIRVSVLCPASVMTEFYDVAGFDKLPYPAEEQLRAEDVAEAACYCASAPKHVAIENIVMWPVCQNTLYR